MKFEFTLKGRDWLGLYLIGLAIYGGQFAVNRLLLPAGGARPGPVDASNAGIAFLVSVITIVAGIFLYVPVFRKFLAHTRLNGVAFRYTGSSPEFVLMYIGNGILSVLTLGIFAPWAIRNVLRHVAKHVEYERDGFGFEGKALDLLEMSIGALVLPIILICIGLALLGKGIGALSAWGLPMVLCFYLVLVPFVYFSLKWMVNFRFGKARIRLDAEAIPSILKILQELFLSIVTLGIYAPAAHARLFKYFADRTKVSKDDGSIWSVKTTLDTLQAWKLTWTVILLTIVTAGVYGAWAYCRTISLYADSTRLERS
jgi:uncharacterized membrane protein YjgN (DUF898 family)